MSREIRLAGPDDAEQIVRIYVDSWNAGFGVRLPIIAADPERIARWRHDLSEVTPTRWWVCERESAVVGFVGIGPSRDPVEPGLGELDTIAVEPEHWRSGIGSALMTMALKALRKDGYKAAILWTLSNYPQAERFYARWGWRLSGATRDGGNQVQYEYCFA